MNYWDAIFMGLIQGLTEFLPISSSAHLVILSDFLQIPSSVAFDVFLHLASLLAVIVYFRQRLLDLIRSFFVNIFGKPTKIDRDNLFFVGYLAVAMIPAAVIGLLFEKNIEQLFTSAKFAGGGLLITAVLLYLADNISKIGAKIKYQKLSFAKVLVIGIVQSLAIMPGISRSGSTVAAGLFQKIERSQAAQFSFILSIPVILGAFVFKLDELILNNLDIWLLLSSGLACFIASYLAIAVFLRIITKYSLKYFALYCLILGLIIIFIK